MTFTIGDEKVAYVQPAETTWCVQIRDGTGLAEGIFTVSSRTYYDTVEEAHDAAKDKVSGGRADRLELNCVAKRFVDGDADE